MEHYIVSARKYRPTTFATVIGQKPLTAALKHAVATDRLAHAYLFCGSRGVGKTSCARIFAKTINCEHRTPDGEACNECDSCRAFNEGSSMNIIELDAASHNGVDEMKALIEQVQVPPAQGRYRVFIIDEVHMLTSSAFNAFLKTLEEPPEYVVFVLATTEKHKIIPTILSRCQIYDFSRITVRDMVEHLSNVAQAEGIEAEPSALSVIARKADGAMRDALSIFDQVAASSLGHVTYQNAIDNLNMLDNAYYSRLVEAMLEGNVQSALLIYKEIRDKGFDSQFFINGLGLYMRDLMLAMQPATLPLIEGTDEERAQLSEIARKCAPQFIYKAMSLCNEADLNYRVATNKQFLVELTLVKLCQLCSPSPGIDDGGEGQLKPIVVDETLAAAPTAQPAQTKPSAQPSAAAPASSAQPGYTAPAPQQHAQPAAQTQQHGASAAQQYSASAAQPYGAPSAQPAQKTAPQASQPAASAAGNAKRPHISLSIKGFNRKKEEEAPAEVFSEGEKRKNPYTDTDVEKAWEAYTKDHPTEHILINTMITCQPKRVGDNAYLVAVDDSIQVDTVYEAKPSLLRHLRDALGNDEFNFEVRVIQGESSPVTWTQREVLQHMVDSKPALKDIINDFGFTLG